MFCNWQLAAIPQRLNQRA
uniref:Uncharacterized protein n=1 Tax=Rhizophora mucronata TaxID=61149 RepID=A0A2P2NT95_RHIMU